MTYCMVSEMMFLELCVLKEKAEAALVGITEDTECQRAQTLAEIAGDYLSSMDQMIETMQENRVAVPQAIAP